MYQMKALSSLYVTFILLGLLEASHQRNIRWHLQEKAFFRLKLKIETGNITSINQKE